MSKPYFNYFILKAMVFNYSDGHSWDHLDSEACRKAFLLIDWQEKKIKELEEQNKLNSVRPSDLGHVLRDAFFSGVNYGYTQAAKREPRNPEKLWPNYKPHEPGPYFRLRSALGLR